MSENYMHAINIEDYDNAKTDAEKREITKGFLNSLQKTTELNIKYLYGKVLQIKESDFIKYKEDDDVYSTKIGNWDFSIWFCKFGSTIGINNDVCNLHCAICPHITYLSEAVTVINVYLQQLAEALLK